MLGDVERVAAAAGEPARGVELRRELSRRIERVRAATAGIPLDRRLRTALVEWLEPLMLSGNWVPELVELAGGRHDLTQAGRYSPQVSWAELAAYDPDVVVLVPCGFDLRRTLTEWQALRADPNWAELRAVRTGHALAIDGNAYFNRPGPRLVDSLEILAHVLHPERCAARRSVEAETAWQRLP